ncbi:helix-turn-helix domain-containing protein [Butyrivibrio sp. AE3004]|uniref:helix-turn-helix domain-containing protein n=1 Tax=Butyrivibrio sp. AE3004 TaxID=1506994 RepID=UPI0004947F0F|nr:helix-turn-helix transcriptional regulator [Butyrivibrio sp. AE3004]
MIISERLFKIMDEKEITQMEFSRATGITQSTVADWKRKKTNPAADKIMLICDVLNISPYELLQDSKRLNEREIDYCVISEGTDKYELLVEFDRLDNKQRERVMGFINALSGEH